MKQYIFDVETDGLYANKIHCLAYCDTSTGLVCSTSYIEQIKDFFLQENVVLIGHNIVLYDIPTIERLLNIEIKAKKIDTLALSWTLFSDRNKHGLGEWGSYFGTEKPKIEDWENLSIQEYIHRCEEDVKINLKLWQMQEKYLWSLYSNQQEIDNYLNYLTFKLECVAEQEKIGIELDLELCNKTLQELEILKEEKIEGLKSAMPKVPVKAIKNYPKVFNKANGEISSIGQKWLDFLKEQNLPENHIESIEYVIDYEEPNPNSHDQIKKWLYSLGWIPEHLKIVKDKVKNTTKKVPQVASIEGQGEICNSIKKLIEIEPKLEHLNSLSIISHRISVFKGFLENEVEGRLYPSMAGYTNTLRLMHKVIVNLPGFDKKWGKEIRSCLIANEGAELCGSDMSALEDSTKQHFIYQYDSKYVNELRTPGFDAHLDIAVLAGLLTKEQSEEHKLYERTGGKEGKSYKSIRFKAKTTNFCATYGGGAEKIALTANIPLKEAEKLHRIYWERNKSIKKVAENVKIKEIRGQKWLYNPVSKFWYSLRAKKDIFSTLNQSTGAFCFDIWVYYVRQQGTKISLQMHDEILFNTYNKETTIANLRNAIKLTNEQLKLNVPLDISIAFGNTYADVH